MAKKTQGTDTKQHDIAAPPENMPLDKRQVRRAFDDHSALWVYEKPGGQKEMDRR